MIYFNCKNSCSETKNREWNFVHPNSANSKYNNIRKMDTDTNTSFLTKIVSRENISKLIFTHMASFIVGATL